MSSFTNLWNRLEKAWKVLVTEESTQPKSRRNRKVDATKKSTQPKSRRNRKVDATEE